MWIFTKYGFYSVVEHKDNAAVVQIRARVKKHLENLIKRFAFLSDVEILELADSDYQFRFNCNKVYWEQIAKGLASDVRYPNFKNECHDTPELTDPDYQNALMDVWGRMAQTQEREIGTFDLD